MKAKLTFIISSITILMAAPSCASNHCANITDALKHDHHAEILDSFSGSAGIVAAHDFGGSMTIICDDRIDMTIGINTHNLDDEYLEYLGDLARRIIHISPIESKKAARSCYESAIIQEKKNDDAGVSQDGLVYGNAVNTSAVHVDCRLGRQFTSFGIFKPSK